MQKTPYPYGAKFSLGLAWSPVAGPIFADVDTELVYGAGDIFDARWVALTFLSVTAIICLPRHFQVMVVENVDERHLATASWLFPHNRCGLSQTKTECVRRS
ncbi:MAG: hypothetical protein HOI95_12095 [Chromatiales bacterium]|nr:hypothetical protein [Chromatiales bacterium]